MTFSARSIFITRLFFLTLFLLVSNFVSAQESDSDGDGVPDSADRYPLVSLAGRLDSDGDGIPNICDNSCLNSGMTAEYQVSVGSFAACALDVAMSDTATLSFL